MEIRAYAHPYETIDVQMVAGWDDARLSRAPVALLYHAAADLDDQARAVERDCARASEAMRIREQFLAYVEAWFDAELVAALQEVQRIDRSNYAVGRRMTRELEVQQARLQRAIIQKDPRRYATYAG
jgi:uncharacterized protein YdeI (YjbR/CyaY-like superfamily)